MTTPCSVDAIMGLLAQTQCRACGYDGCLPYAEALAQRADRDISKCRPGGQDTADKLANLMNYEQQFIRQEPTFVQAVVNVEQCIGCNLCMKICPVDAFVGQLNYEHQVIEKDCTGCELCLPVCPTQCISLVERQMPLPTISDNLSAIDKKKERLLAEKSRKIQAHEKALSALSNTEKK